MKRLFLLSVLVSTLALAAAGCGDNSSPRSASQAASSNGVQRADQGDTYLTLGDSVAAGVGASDRDNGYADVLFKALQEDDPTLTRHVNLAIPGETSASLIRRQLDHAVDELRTGDVRLATFAIGANDLLRLLRDCASQIDSPECKSKANAAIDELRKNIDESLDTLLAVESGTRFVVVGYYNPLGSVLPDTAQYATQLNQALHDAADERGLDFVEIASLFRDKEASLTRILSGDVHPNDDGHREIAQAIAAFLGHDSTAGGAQHASATATG